MLIYLKILVILDISDNITLAPMSKHEHRQRAIALRGPVYRVEK
jgi:hypothetical protein